MNRAEEISFLGRKDWGDHEQHKKQIGHFTVTVLVKVKAEGGSLLCKLNLACFLSPSLS